MPAVYITGGILLIIILVLLLPVGGVAEYDASGIRVWLRLGPFRFPLLPRTKTEDGPKQEKAKRPKKEKKQQPDAEGGKKSGGLGELLELLPLVIDSLGRLKRSITLKELTLYFTFAAEDPAKAALSFGAASAGAGMLVPLLQSHFRIKSMDIRNAVDFCATQTQVYARGDLHIRVVALLTIGLRALLQYLHITRARKAAAPREPSEKKESMTERK